MNNKWVTMVVSAVVFVVVWNLLDYLSGTFLFGGGYQFKVIGDVVTPIIVSFIVDYFIFKSGKNA